MPDSDGALCLDADQRVAGVRTGGDAIPIRRAGKHGGRRQRRYQHLTTVVSIDYGFCGQKLAKGLSENKCINSLAEGDNSSRHGTSLSLAGVQPSVDRKS